MLGAIGRRYKFVWQGCNKGTTDVGVFIAERWIDSVIDVCEAGDWKVDSKYCLRLCSTSGFKC